MKKHYIVKDGRLSRSNPFCPRCGAGVFMADKGEWWSCGKCGDRYYKGTSSSKANAKCSKEWPSLLERG